MEHAKGWAYLVHPDALLIEAKPAIMRTPDGRVMTREEDIWGVFDLLVCPRTACPIQALQVTSAKGGAASTRRAKVAEWIKGAPLCGERPFWLGGAHVIAWVSRRHFRWWRWDWSRAVWVEDPPVAAPTLRSLLGPPSQRPDAQGSP